VPRFYYYFYYNNKNKNKRQEKKNKNNKEEARGGLLLVIFFFTLASCEARAKVQKTKITKKREGQRLKNKKLLPFQAGGQGIKIILKTRPLATSKRRSKGETRGAPVIFSLLPYGGGSISLFVLRTSSRGP
jgi:hypothetical protein